MASPLTRALVGGPGQGPPRGEPSRERDEGRVSKTARRPRGARRRLRPSLHGAGRGRGSRAAFRGGAFDLCSEGREGGKGLLSRRNGVWAAGGQADGGLFWGEEKGRGCIGAGHQRGSSPWTTGSAGPRGSCAACLLLALARHLGSGVSGASPRPPRPGSLVRTCRGGRAWQRRGVGGGGTWAAWTVTQ